MMYKGFKIVSDVSAIRFMSVHVPAMILSLIIVIGSIGLTITKGLNFGIDFTGGMLIEVRYDESPDLGDMRNALNGLGMGSVSLQEFGAANDFLIRFPQSENMDAAEVEIKVKEVLNGFSDTAVDYRRFEFVGPQVGEELINAGIWAIVFSMIGILIYVSFRFEWHFGIAAIAALIHDAISIIGLFALTQMEFDLTTIAAVLMIAGYSINDTVVIFDRVRENLRKYKKKTLPEILDMSLNQTLARTLLTSGTTLIALVALWLFGGEVIRGFVDALIFGIVIGTYSTIFVAAPLLIYLGLRAKDVEAPETTSAEEKMI